MEIKEILDNCDTDLKEEDLNTFIQTIANYILEYKCIDAEISFGSLEEGLAKCYISSSVTTKNGIVTRNKSTYKIGFDLSKVLVGSGLNSGIVNQIPKKLDIIHTIAHEIEHAVQEERLTKNNLYSNDYLLIAKEKFCSTNFYECYWDKFRKETNAELNGWQTVLEMLYDLSPESYNKYGYLINKEIENIRRLENNAQISAYLNGNFTTLPAPQMITIASTEEIKKRSDTAFVMYPILKYVYNADGTKKDYFTLMKESDALITHLTGNELQVKTQANKIIKFYEDIISSDRDLIEARKKTEFTQQEELENHMLPNEKTNHRKLNRPKIKVQVRSHVVLKREKEKLKRLKESIIEQQEISMEEIIEEDNGMHM